MTVELEQEDAIASIEKLEILPVKAQVVIKDVENCKLVTRKYQIHCIDYPVNFLVIQYSLSSYKEQVKDYLETDIYTLLKDTKDKVYTRDIFKRD